MSPRRARIIRRAIHDRCLERGLTAPELIRRCYQNAKLLWYRERVIDPDRIINNATEIMTRPGRLMGG